MFTLNCKGRLLSLDKPVVMGIINMTPDSFYSGSRATQLDEILRKAEQMIAEGATILDCGGQSTRPSSKRISEDEEMERVLDPIDAIHSRFPEVFISIDTYQAGIAKRAIEAGASIVNDISSGSLDAEMIATVAALKVPYVLMHMRGDPSNMQEQTDYDNLPTDILDFFIRKKAELRKQGVGDIIVDPGFGFAKNITQNFQLLGELEMFRMLEAPLLVGLSRKSTVYKTLNTDPENALNGTTVLNTIALMKGANILRVHDVKEALEAIKLVDSLISR